MSRAARLLLLVPPLSGCKLLLGPPLKPGEWDLTVTGLDVAGNCDSDLTQYDGETEFEGMQIRWHQMQTINVRNVGSEPDGFELGARFSFDMAFDGESTFFSDNVDAEARVEGGSFRSYGTEVTFEVDERTRLFGSALMADDLRCQYCDFGGSCDFLRFWFEAEWVGRN